jgi:hypothetical protein
VALLILIHFDLPFVPCAFSLIPLNNTPNTPPLPIQDGQQVNTLRAADEIPRLKAAPIPVDFPEATTARATTIGLVSDPSSCPSSVSMLERGPPIITPVADGSGSPFSSKMAAYRRVLPRRSGRRALLPCMICFGCRGARVSSGTTVLSHKAVKVTALLPPSLPHSLYSIDKTQDSPTRGFLYARMTGRLSPLVADGDSCDIQFR